MKKLYLVRHAKSSWKQPELSDFERPLNKRGKRDAPFMGNILNEKGIMPDLIISSPAVRAYTTARIIAEEIGYPPEKIETNEDIYEASAGEILDIINGIEDHNNTVMIFGHNPGFTSLSNYLSGKFIDNIPTCGISIIEFDVDKWEDVVLNGGKLISFEFPKKYISDKE